MCHLVIFEAGSENVPRFLKTRDEDYKLKCNFHSDSDS